MRLTKDSSLIIRRTAMENFLGTTEQHMKVHGKMIMLLEKEFSFKRVLPIEAISKMMN